MIPGITKKSLKIITYLYFIWTKKYSKIASSYQNSKIETVWHQ